MVILAMQKNPLTEELLQFVKEHLPKTEFYNIHVFWRKETYYNQLDQSDLIHLAFHISQELGVYFKRSSTPVLQTESNSSEAVASSI